MSARGSRAGGMSAAAFGAAFSSGARVALPPAPVEEAQPNVPVRALSFPGGPVDTSGFVESHHGPTPTTLYAEPPKSVRVVAFLELARLNIAEALDSASAFDRKFSIKAAQVSLEQALELLE